MNALHLKTILETLGKSQAELARYLHVSPATVTGICKYGRWPRKLGSRPKLEPRIHTFLRDAGADEATVARALNEAPDMRCANSACPMAVNTALSGPLAATTTEDTDMLPRKHTITPDARDHFGLPRDPFTNELRGVTDVFMNDNIRKVRAAIRNLVQHGGMMAVIAESGAGKSTLRKDLTHWVRSSDQPVTVIEPYIVGMEDHENKGRPLRAEDIVSAIIRRLSPGTAIRQTHQARVAQMHDVLRASAEAGNRHVLVIEEGHRLARPTIRHFKGFYELDDGFASLLSILVIGQTELDWKLSETDYEVREVVQRLEKRYLEPIDNDIEAYLRHKFARVDGNYDQVFEKDVPEAILHRLRVTKETRLRGQRTLGPRSLCYPLAINNLVSGAINAAQQAGEDKVSGRLIALVDRDEEL